VALTGRQLLAPIVSVFVELVQSIAIVGLGRAGLLHAKAARSIGLEVVSHASLSRHSPRSIEFQREFPDSRAFGANDFSICETAQLVVLATPPSVTHQVVSEYLRRCPWLLVEKPLALTTARIHELCRLGDASGAKVVVGYNRRSYPAISRVNEILLNDPPVSVQVQIVEDMQHVKASKSDDLHSVYLRHGSAAHFLDLVQYLFGVLEIDSMDIASTTGELGFIDYRFAGRCGRGASIVGSIDAGERSRRGLKILTRAGRNIHLSPLDRVSISHPETDRPSRTAQNVEVTEYSDSHFESFKTQLFRVVNGEAESLHDMRDSLDLSKLIDAFEVVSSSSRNV